MLDQLAGSRHPAANLMGVQHCQKEKSDLLRLDISGEKVPLDAALDGIATDLFLENSYFLSSL
jgi:hypothetical protein